MRTVTADVLRLYLAHPFPQWSTEERRRRFATEFLRYRFLGLEDKMPQARLLDVGCGTGNRTMLVAKNLGVGRFVGLDRSAASLKIAGRVAREEGFDRFDPLEGNLFELPFANEAFDVVVSWGVLHHTSDPERGFREMVRVCRPGGIVGIFLYNRFAHWRHNQLKDRVSREAGSDIESRFAVAHRIYGKKPVDQMTPEEIAVFYDEYCHPHESDHTLGDMLQWFDRAGLVYTGSFPPLRIRDALAALRFRGQLAAEYPLAGKANRILASSAGLLPPPRISSHFRRPSIAHRFLWQLFYSWLGRHGAYSFGASMSARKPESS